jgi:predicted helicase
MLVKVVLGNPPYSVVSSNKGKIITDLLEDYRKNLNEKNIQPLSDDYIKFIRFGQYQIKKSGEGILAYICNNGFLDGIIYRQMRKSLSEAFDKIYVLNLHGNARKKESGPDGSKDENVFDIMQGVSINIFVKTSKSRKPAEVFYRDLYGKREDKYKFLSGDAINICDFQKINPTAPYYFFVPKDFSGKDEYDKGFGIRELFVTNSCGIITHNDSLAIHYSRSELEKCLSDFR